MKMLLFFQRFDSLPTACYMNTAHFKFKYNTHTFHIAAAAPTLKNTAA